LPKNLTPVFHDDLEKVTLLAAFLQSDGLSVKIVPDVKSPPLMDPAAHCVKSQYTLHLLLVPEDEVERARELIAEYQN
jgi:hypothetical protein